jgi:O-antigen biosynthesis protein
MGTGLKTELMHAHRALCSPFVAEELFRRALGGTRGDLGTIAVYLQLPIERRPPLSYYFDRDFYLAANPDVAKAGLDPLLHFIDTGIAELRAPHPLIDLQFIVGQDPLVLGERPAIALLFDMLEYDLADPSPYFCLADYLAQLGPEAPHSGLLRHFLTVGLPTGRRPNPYLDPTWYAQNNADVPQDVYGALRHFVMVGDREARRAGPGFDGALYRARYPDVADAGVAPLRHFMVHGRHEQRQAAVERQIEPGGSARPGIQAPVGEPMVPAAAPGEVYAGIQARLAEAVQERKDGVRAVPPPMLRSEDPAADAASLRLPPGVAPRLSILVPVFNEFDVTVECLMSIAAAAPGLVSGGIEFEVVVADDCSTDPAVAGLAGIENIVFLRQKENLGFIRNCNAAFARCRGDYVLLLNNDAQAAPGAVARMVAALDADPALAAVGPKLVYPNGRLQEAGCFIRPNGESGMVGLFRDPLEPGFCYDRDVAYCSGAALMFRRALAGATLFDEAFRPAYCEDADLCLRFIAAGHRVRYVHEALVVHHLSVSSNRQSVSRKLRTIARNQQTLTERWGSLLRRMDAVRPIAFYLPQFHPTPENDLWWGRGFTEWTNVARARPSYGGHYQPHLPADLGFYDLRSADALRQQALTARRYGIEGFCVYYYNFGSRRVLAEPIEVVRAHPDIPFNWCLCWANENWTKHWDGGTKEILLEQSYDDATLAAIIADATAQAADPRYIRVDGKPLFLVYRPLMLPDPQGFASLCRAGFAAAGFPGVQLVYVESMEAVDKQVRPADLGFDAAVEFPPHGRAVPSTSPADIVKEGWSGYRYDYPETVLAFLKRETVSYPRYPAVFPSWDNTPRQSMRGTSFDGADPDAFRFYVEEKIEEARQFLTGDQRLLFVNAWNEWAEGAHLEPDSGYGHRWLEAMRDALAAKRWS